MAENPRVTFNLAEAVANVRSGGELPRSRRRVQRDSVAQPYTAALRNVVPQASRRFEPDHCPNCMHALPQRVQRLFCSEQCRQTAKAIRYWRGILRDGRIVQPDVQEALKTKVAFLLAGGYPEQSRRLPTAVRNQVWSRDKGRCRECGKPGKEIDHIDGGAAELTNLQLLCLECHHRKTSESMAPASSAERQIIEEIQRDRVIPDMPTLLCDWDQWKTVEVHLRKERGVRLLAELAQYGHRRRDFVGYSWAEMWDEVLGIDPEQAMETAPKRDDHREARDMRLLCARRHDEPKPTPTDFAPKRAVHSTTTVGALRRSQLLRGSVSAHQMIDGAMRRISGLQARLQRRAHRAK